MYVLIRVPIEILFFDEEQLMVCVGDKNYSESYGPGPNMNGRNHDWYGTRDKHNLNDEGESLFAGHAIFCRNPTRDILEGREQINYVRPTEGR